MSIKLTAKEVTDRVTSNKNCIISYYPHPHSPPEKSELKRFVEEAHRKGQSIIPVSYTHLRAHET